MKILLIIQCSIDSEITRKYILLKFKLIFINQNKIQASINKTYVFKLTLRHSR